jgi:hypothetical protein
LASKLYKYEHIYTHYTCAREAKPIVKAIKREGHTVSFAIFVMYTGCGMHVHEEYSEDNIYIYIYDIQSYLSPVASGL